jgi:hypothetical protein
MARIRRAPQRQGTTMPTRRLLAAPAAPYTGAGLPYTVTAPANGAVQIAGVHGVGQGAIPDRLWIVFMASIPGTTLWSFMLGVALWLRSQPMRLDRAVATVQSQRWLPLLDR